MPEGFVGFHGAVGGDWFERELLEVAPLGDADTFAVAPGAEVGFGGGAEDQITRLGGPMRL